MKKIVWTFGLIAGAILSAMMLATMPFITEIGDRSEIIGYTTMVVAFLLIFFGVRAYRDNVSGGTIRFGRAFGVGILIALIASLCYTATWEALYFGRPSFRQKFTGFYEAQIRAKGGTPAEVDKKIAEARQFAEMYSNPVINAGITLLEPLPVGLVIALVSAGVLSRRRRLAGQLATASS